MKIVDMPNPSNAFYTHICYVHNVCTRIHSSLASAQLNKLWPGPHYLDREPGAHVIYLRTNGYMDHWILFDVCWSEQRQIPPVCFVNHLKRKFKNKFYYKAQGRRGVPKNSLSPEREKSTPLALCLASARTRASSCSRSLTPVGSFEQSPSKLCISSSDDAIGAFLMQYSVLATRFKCLQSSRADLAQAISSSSER